MFFFHLTFGKANPIILQYTTRALKFCLACHENVITEGGVAILV